MWSTIRKFSVYSAFSLLAILMSVAMIGYQANFSDLFENKLKDRAFPISTIKIVDNFNNPDLSSNEFERLLTDTYYNPPSFDLKVPHSALSGRKTLKTEKIRSQISRILKKNEYKTDLKNKTVYFYADINPADFQKIKNPNLFFHAFYSPWEIYIDGKFKHLTNLPRKNHYFFFSFPASQKKPIRIIWKVKNNYQHEVRGIHSRWGISIISEEDAIWGKNNLANQESEPTKIASWLLICAVFFLFLLAIHSKGYSDLWGAAAFCTMTWFCLFIDLPYFYLSWANGYDLSSVQATGHIVFAISFIGVALCTFRLLGNGSSDQSESHLIPEQSFNGSQDKSKSRLEKCEAWLISKKNLLSWGIFLSFTGILGKILLINWPMKFDIAASTIVNGAVKKVSAHSALQAIDNNIVFWVPIFYGLSILLGGLTQYSAYDRFKKEKVKPLAKRMKKRMWETAGVHLCLVIMGLIFGAGFTGRSASTIDYWLIVGVLPAYALIIYYYRAIQETARIQQARASQINLIDHWLVQFGSSALKEILKGMLTVSDMAGYKKIDALRERSDELRDAVDDFLLIVETHFAKMKQQTWDLLRYKTNRDEFISLYHAKSNTESLMMMCAYVLFWENNGANLIKTWKDVFREKFKDLLHENEINSILEKFDFHLMACTCDDIKITVLGSAKNPVSRPDFVSSRYSQLSQPFKKAYFNKIAAYRDDANQLLEILDVEARYIGMHGSPDDDLGFIVFPSHPDFAVKKTTPAFNWTEDEIYDAVIDLIRETISMKEFTGVHHLPEEKVLGWIESFQAGGRDGINKKVSKLPTPDSKQPKSKTVEDSNFRLQKENMALKAETDHLKEKLKMYKTQTETAS